MIENVSAETDLTHFGRPVESFGSIDPESVAALIEASADVALVVDEQGVVRDVAFSNTNLAKDAYRAWVGQRWIDTVTIESRPKIEEMVLHTATRTASRWRQVNYPTAQGPDVPIRYSAVRYGADRRLVVVGRDLRAMAVLQQRLTEAQQSMEREYARIRGEEKRYRLLFQLASEAVLIVDSANLRIIEANPAASVLIGRDVKKLVGHSFGDLFAEASKQATQSFVAALRVAPRVDNVHVQLAGGKKSLLLSGSLFRQENSAHLLVLLSNLAGETTALSEEKSNLLQIVERIPDAFIVTDIDRKIMTANLAFLDLIQAVTIDQIRGEPFDRWVGRAAADMDLLFTNLRMHGVVRNFSTVLRGEYGSDEEVEIAAVSVAGGVQPCFGFTIRTADRRAGREQLGGHELPRTVEQFSHLIGRVPLKNIVRETTDLIERLCIEAALDLTRDNRASAADMLGLSRQGLYAKLRRYGLGDLDSSSSN